MPGSLHVEATGPQDAPALLFLHGIGASGWMWWQQVPAFPDHLRLVVDLPGHGGSRDVPWVSLADTAERVAAVVRARAATGRAHVVGLSLGGHVVLSLVEHHPDVVDRAVVSGVTAEPWPYRRFLGPVARLTAAQLGNRRLLTARARSLGLPPVAQAAFVENALAMRPQTYRRIVAEIAGHAVSTTPISAPVLVLAGSTESAAIRRAAVTVPAALPGAVGRIAPGVGHGWNVEAPDLFSATVQAWIHDAPLPADLVPAG